MIYILLSILLNASLFLIFRLFVQFKIDTFQAIVFNYFFAFVVAYFSSDIHFSYLETPKQDWFFGALFLGFLFISLFYTTGLTAQKLGLSVVAVAGKMSVVIPVLFGVIVYNESSATIKIIGIFLAIIAVYFTSVKQNIAIKESYIHLPILLFFGSGILDTILKYIEKNYVSTSEISVYLSTIFLTAGILGFLSVLFLVFFKNQKLKWKNFIAGIVLGVPNYFAMYFLLKALQTEGLESSTIFSINNVSIVLISTLLGLFVFKEGLSKNNIFGIALAIISIVLITLSI